MKSPNPFNPEKSFPIIQVIIKNANDINTNIRKNIIVFLNISAGFISITLLKEKE